MSSIRKINLRDKKLDVLKKHLLCKLSVLELSKHPTQLQYIPYKIDFISRKKSMHLCMFDDPHNHPYCIKNKIKLFTRYIMLKIKKNGKVKILRGSNSWSCDPRFKKYFCYSSYY
jgi:hypothetical protein